MQKRILVVVIVIIIAITFFIFKTINNQLNPTIQPTIVTTSISQHFSSVIKNSGSVLSIQKSGGDSKVAYILINPPSTYSSPINITGSFISQQLVDVYLMTDAQFNNYYYDWTPPNPIYNKQYSEFYGGEKGGSIDTCLDSTNCFSDYSNKSNGIYYIVFVAPYNYSGNASAYYTNITIIQPIVLNSK